MEEISAYVQAKLDIRWVSQLSRPFSVLSTNVIREICLYLSQVPQILSVDSRQVMWLDTDAKRWLLLCKLSQPIIVSLGSASLFVSPQLLLVSGGYSVKAGVLAAVNCVYRIDPNTGLTEGLENGLNVSRFAHGSVYYASTLYAFGGLQDQELLSVCEEIPLHTTTRRPLPQMQVKRAWFNPCLYTDMVYLCSHGITEIYTPISNQLKPCELQCVGQEPYAVAVLNKGQLIVLTSEYRHSWVIGTKGGFKQSARAVCSRLWSRCSPTVIGDSLYLVSFDKTKTAVQLSLSTGMVIRLISAYLCFIMRTAAMP